MCQYSASYTKFGRCHIKQSQSFWFRAATSWCLYVLNRRTDQKHHDILNSCQQASVLTWQNIAEKYEHLREALGAFETCVCGEYECVSMCVDMRGRAQAYTWARLCVSKDLSCLHTHTPIPFHSKRVIAESLPSFPLNFCPPLPLYPSIICFVSKCGVSILMWKGEINVARLPSVFMFVINPKKCYPCTIFLLPSVFSSCSWAALQMNVIWHQTSRFLFFFFSPFCLSAAVVFSFFFFFPEDEGKPCIKMARERRGGIFWVWQSAQIHTSLKLSKQWHLLKIPHWFRIQSGMPFLPQTCTHLIQEELCLFVTVIITICSKF